MEFLAKMVSLVEKHIEAFQFILSFNAHFEPGENLIVQALRNRPPITFGQLLTMELNRCRADNRGMKIMLNSSNVEESSGEHFFPLIFRCILRSQLMFEFTVVWASFELSIEFFLCSIFLQIYVHSNY